MPPVNGTSPRGLPKGSDDVTLNRRREMLEDMVYNEMMHRTEWFSSMLDKRRNMEKEFHYPLLGEHITANYYRQIFDRDSIAARVCQLMPRECFQVQPSVYEDESNENTTEFEEAVDSLGDQLGEGASWYREEKGSRVWEYLRRADELSGVGRFGILLIGIDDGCDLSEPAEGVVTTVAGKDYTDTPPTKEQTETLKTLNSLNAHEMRVINRLETTTNKKPEAGYKHGNGPTSDAHSSSGPLFGQHPMGTDQQYFGTQLGQSEQMGEKPSSKCRKLLYLRAFDESLIQIVRWEWNQNNPRFGKPVMYRVTLHDPSVQHTGIGLPLATVFVHWSRVIHLADNLGSSEVMGVPRLQPVLNDVLASYKCRHAGAEGYWKGAIPGLKFSTHPSMGGDVDVNPTQLRDAAENYHEGLQRYLYGVGGAWETISPAFADPTPVHNLAIECICVQLGCPVRIFKGSERGELASSQDDAQWNDRIMSRQWTYITPRIIIPLFDRLILIGVLPEPCQETEEVKSGMGLPSSPEDAGIGAEIEEEEGAEPTDMPFTPKKKIPPPKPPTTTNRYKYPVGEIYSVRRKRKVLVRNAETGEMTEKTIVEKANAVRTAKGYVVEWPELDSMTLMDKAKYAQTMVASLGAYVSGGCEAMVTRKDYFTKYELRDEEEAEAMVCDAEEQAIQDEEEAALKAAEQGLEVDPNDPTAVVDPDALPPGVTEVDEDGAPTIPKGVAPAPSFSKKGPPVPPGQPPGGGGFPPKKGPPKPPVGNTALLELAINIGHTGWVTLDNDEKVYLKDGTVEVGPKAVKEWAKEKAGPEGKVKPRPQPPKEGEKPTKKPDVPAKSIKPVAFSTKEDRPAAIAHAQETHGKWASNLTDSQKKALGEYSDEAVYKPINNGLRTGDGKIPKGHEDTVANLDSAIASAPPFERDTVLHRGVGPKGAASLQVGKEFTDDGYVSTSINEHTVHTNFASEAVVRINAPKGTKAAAMDATDVGAFKGSKSENEYLLPRGTKFKVTGRERHPDGYDVIHAEIVQ